MGEHAQAQATTLEAVTRQSPMLSLDSSVKGQLPLGLVVLKDGVSQSHDEVEKELIASVRASIGAVACFNRALIVERLPKTRSGKIMRRILRKIAANEHNELGDTTTLADPSVVESLIENRQNKN